MVTLFQRLREPIEPILDASPESVALARRVGEQRGRYDQAVEGLKRANRPRARLAVD